MKKVSGQNPQLPNAELYRAEAARLQQEEVRFEMGINVFEVDRLVGGLPTASSVEDAQKSDPLQANWTELAKGLRAQWEAMGGLGAGEHKEQVGTYRAIAKATKEYVLEILTPAHYGVFGADGQAVLSSAQASSQLVVHKDYLSPGVAEAIEARGAETSALAKTLVDDTRDWVMGESSKMPFQTPELEAYQGKTFGEFMNAVADDIQHHDSKLITSGLYGLPQSPQFRKQAAKELRQIAKDVKKPNKASSALHRMLMFQTKFEGPLSEALGEASRVIDWLRPRTNMIEGTPGLVGVTA